MMFLGRWHHLIRIRVSDAVNQFAALEIAGFDGKSRALAFFGRFLADIQSQFGLARTLIRPVARKAFGGNDRANLRIEINRGFARNLFCEGGESERADKKQQQKSWPRSRLVGSSSNLFLRPEHNAKGLLRGIP